VLVMTRGRYHARLASEPADLLAAQTLRHRAFHGRRGPLAEGALDSDTYDACARHVLIEDRAGGGLVACYRLQFFAPAEIEGSYSAQFYDLSRLRAFPGTALELGRFCLHPDHHDPDILRLAWAVLTRMVDEGAVGLLFGCSSFAGADPYHHGRALAALAQRSAPDQWRPGPRAPERVPLNGTLDLREAGGTIPPLLRTYLGMGGWVSDHAVIDRALDTLHVFTGVEIARIPAARARALREIAA
jgi:L-ornithine Nalpha-acyltransferase